MLGIKIGEREMTDLAFNNQIVKNIERGQIVIIGIFPPVKLEQIERLHIHSTSRSVDTLLNNSARHQTWTRYPFGKELHLRERVAVACRQPLTAKFADQIFCRT